MSDTVMTAGPNDSLWAIAQRCGVPGGGAGWNQMSVQRGGTTYNLANQTLPGGLQPGDKVTIPQEVAHSCQGEVDQIASGLNGTPPAASAQGNAAQAAATAAPASGVTAQASCSTKVIFVLDPGHGGRAARAQAAIR